ncbi:MAG: DUF1835 domain-containing protein [Bacteroidetes bacterium]|nr:DUF1835 domain-containing protein [Bacteroidota bacterium]
MKHVLFNEADRGLFEEIVALDPELEGEIFLIRDDYAVGPIAELETAEGQVARLDWWRRLFSDTPYGEEAVEGVDDLAVVTALCRSLDEDPESEVWIWIGQNQHDVMGYYWLIPHLKPYAGRIQVLYMNNLPFINEKGQLFYPAWLSEIPAKEFKKAKKLARPVTLSEFEIDPDEFNRLKIDNAMVRILEGGKKILGQPLEYFDTEILRQVTKDYQKAPRVLQQVLQKMNVRTGDVFLMHRLREMLRTGRLQTSGEPDRSWKDLDIKLPGTSGAATAREDEQTSTLPNE